MLGLNARFDPFGKEPFQALVLEVHGHASSVTYVVTGCKQMFSRRLEFHYTDFSRIFGNSGQAVCGYIRWH